ncbi:hypothetical protein VKY20_00615 [Pseudomonas atacamensis]|uniref:hypothetical protein n=1 Tax=Pseudomonas atacamensis TaxID=2565368 RepID=UPI002B49DF95|nr:hypothetical protein [Pseudomonas atacamensis]MEB2854100.1 hypothetical protein [Pseudomonas atacamensis]
MNRSQWFAGLKIFAMFFAMWLVPRALSYDVVVVILYFISIGASAVYLFFNRRRIVENIKAWPSSFTFTVLVFYVAKLMAEKTINSTMGVEAEYIKQSSIIGGVIISIPLSLVVASCALFARSGYLKIREWVTRKERFSLESNKGKQEFFPGLRPMFACCVLLLAGLLLSQAERGIRYAVMLDAMMYSDCGPAEHGLGYIRKNAHACYQYDTRFFKGSSVPKEIASTKP